MSDTTHTSPDRRILVAGIGNIFLGDDAFGVEVVRRLDVAGLPAGVEVRDFGIRGYDLAFALLEPYDAVVLIDAAPRGRPPGTLYLIEPDRPRPGTAVPADAHGLDPVRVLAMAEQMGGCRAPVYLVGCEPASLAPVAGGLSEPVRAALPGAIDLLNALLGDLHAGRTPGMQGSGAGTPP